MTVWRVKGTGCTGIVICAATTVNRVNEIIPNSWEVTTLLINLGIVAVFVFMYSSRKIIIKKL